MNRKGIKIQSKKFHEFVENFMKSLGVKGLRCVLLITRLLRLVGRLSALNRFNHTSGVTAVTPTDRP